MNEAELVRLAELLDAASRLVQESIDRMPRKSDLEFQHSIDLLRRRLQKLRAEP